MLAPLSNYNSSSCTFFNMYRLPVKNSEIDIPNGICMRCSSLEELNTFVKTAVNSHSFVFFMTNVLYFIEKCGHDNNIFIVFHAYYLNFITLSVNNIDINNVIKLFYPLIQNIHRNRFIHYNICNESLLTANSTFNNTIIPSLQVSNKITSFTTLFSKSPIRGSVIISPIQVIIEMMHSRVESNEIPITEFKLKFIKFYNTVAERNKNVCYNTIFPFKNILDLCQYYFGISYGAIDYIDYIIHKLCVVKDKHIVKCYSKAVYYKTYIDWFGFGLVLHSLISNYSDIINNNKSKETTDILKFISSIIAFDIAPELYLH